LLSFMHSSLLVTVLFGNFFRHMPQPGAANFEHSAQVSLSPFSFPSSSNIEYLLSFFVFTALISSDCFGLPFSSPLCESFLSLFFACMSRRLPFIFRCWLVFPSSSVLFCPSSPSIRLPLFLLEMGAHFGHRYLHRAVLSAEPSFSWSIPPRQRSPFRFRCLEFSASSTMPFFSDFRTPRDSLRALIAPLIASVYFPKRVIFFFFFLFGFFGLIAKSIDSR